MGLGVGDGAQRRGLGTITCTEYMHPYHVNVIVSSTEYLSPSHPLTLCTPVTVLDLTYLIET